MPPTSSTGYPPPEERHEEMARWILNGEFTRKQCVERAQVEWGLGRSKAHDDYNAASRLAGLGAINDQLVTGALALHVSMVCLGDAMRLAKEMETQPTTGLERAHKAYCRTGNLARQIADTAMRLRPGEMLTSDEGKELLLRALEQGAASLTGEDRARLELLTRAVVPH